MHIIKTLRNYFLRGVAALLPTILTVWLFIQLYQFVQNNASIHINNFIVKIFLWLGSDSTAEELRQFWVSGRGQIVGLIITLLFVCFLGAVLASVVGRSVWRWIEDALTSMPLIKRVYPYVKQLTDAIFIKENKLAFKRVVAVEYPRREMWSLGLVTGNGVKRIAQKADDGDEMLSLFIPSSPMPFTGYVIMVPESETIPLDLTIEEALRFTVSGGVVTPTHWQKLHSEMHPDEQEATPKISK